MRVREGGVRGSGALGLAWAGGGRKPEGEGPLRRAGGRGAGSLRDLAARADLGRRPWELIAEADALRSVGLDRRAGLWAVKGLGAGSQGRNGGAASCSHGPPAEGGPAAAMALPAHVAEDYRTTSLSLKAHPCGFFRSRLDGWARSTPGG